MRASNIRLIFPLPFSSPSHRAAQHCFEQFLSSELPLEARSVWPYRRGKVVRTPNLYPGSIVFLVVVICIIAFPSSFYAAANERLTFLFNVLIIQYDLATESLDIYHPVAISLTLIPLKAML